MVYFYELVSGPAAETSQAACLRRFDCVSFRIVASFSDALDFFPDPLCSKQKTINQGL